MACGCRGQKAPTYTPEQLAAMEERAEQQRARRQERIERHEAKMAARRAARAARLGLKG